MHSLRELAWPAAYGSGDDLVSAFYVPALTASIRYDRYAGFFSSQAVRAAAPGFASFFGRGGQLRLLLGAEMSEADARALAMAPPASGHESGSDRLDSEESDPGRLESVLQADLEERPAEALRRLVQKGRISAKVLAPSSPGSVPARGYFHAKGGVFWDVAMEGIAFSGSINEMATGWRVDHERIHIFPSWREAAHFWSEVDAFERLWASREPGWEAMRVDRALSLGRLAFREPENPAL